MSWQVHLASQIALFAIQFLVPAFLTTTSKQEAAIAAFVSAVQTALAMYAHFQPAPGEKAVDPPKQP